LGRISQKTLQI